jgi:hypothetical protein
MVFEMVFSLGFHFSNERPATIGLAFILDSQLFSLECVSNICALGLAMVGLMALNLTY